MNDIEKATNKVQELILRRHYQDSELLKAMGELTRAVHGKPETEEMRRCEAVGRDVNG